MQQMEQKNIRVSVPTGGQRKTRRAFGLRDVLVTLAIALFIVAIGFAWNRARSPGEGAFTAASVLAGGATGAAPAIGSPAPDFELPLLSGGTIKLSDLRGKVVWVNFWATWCPPCRAEMPDIEKIWKSEQGSDLVIIGVDYGEATPTVQGFVNKLGITYPIALDRNGTVAAAYRLAGFPSHFYVDKQGILREIKVGLMSEETMRERIQKLRSY